MNLQTTMLVEIKACELPTHIGKTVVLYDSETKKEERIELTGVDNGWAKGYNKTKKCISEISPGFTLKKIFIDL
jgi:hypothetical protein